MSAHCVHIAIDKQIRNENETAAKLRGPLIVYFFIDMGPAVQ